MRIPSPPRIPFTLVGRDGELSVLREHLDSALTGQGNLVLIDGEAGIGKTALAEMLCREATEQGALVLIGRCYDLTDTPPYGPWIELFGQYQQRDRLPRLPTAFSERGTIGQVLSQTALVQQVQAFFAELSAHQPIVLLLDDLHWSDSASLELLRVVARTVATMPIFVVVAYRADELTRRHPLSVLLPLLAREAITERLHLTPLDDPAIRAFLAERYDLRTADSARLAAYLRARGEGNPLFVGELVRALEETGILRRKGDTWTLEALSQTPVPTLLRQVIEGRLNRLDEETQRLLALAAVIGQEIPYALWGTAAEASEELLLAVVERAEVARVMEETAGGTAVRFTHALIREALYAGVRPSLRKRWHRRVGEVLVAGIAPDPDAVSYHFRAAGDGRAVAWLVAAGERALSVFAWVTATERFRVALALMEGEEIEPCMRALVLYGLGIVQTYLAPKHGVRYLEEARRLALEGRDAALAAASLYHLGQMRCNAGEVRHGIADMEAGVIALRSLPPEEAARSPSLTAYGLSLTGNNSAGALVLWLGNAGRHSEALAIGEPLLAESGKDARALSDFPSGAVALGMAVAYAARGEPDAARRAFSDAYAGYNAVGHSVQATIAAQRDLWWRVLPYHIDNPAECDRVAAQAAYALGQASGVVGEHPAWEVRESLVRVSLMVLRGEWDEVRRLVIRIGRHPLLHLIRGPLAYAQGEIAAAWEVVREDLPDGPDTAPGDSMFLGMLGTQRLAALLALDAGDLTTARAWLEAHDRWLVSNDSVLGLAEGHLVWARYYRVAGDSERADQHARRALEHATEPRQPLALLAAHRLLGELATASGRVEDASRHLDAAQALASVCAAPFERALTLLAQAELRAAMGDTETACTVLDEVRAICTPLGAKPALARTDALAARFAAIRMITPASPAGLSPREVEVLRLLAAGRTNREIAAILFISVYTVRNHVTHILEKTGTEHRAAAAAFAVRHGLT